MAQSLLTHGSHIIRVLQIVELCNPIKRISVCDFSSVCLCYELGICTDNCRALALHTSRLRDEKLKALWVSRAHRAIRFSSVHLLCLRSQ